jgi:hypothetical protein
MATINRMILICLIVAVSTYSVMKQAPVWPEIPTDPTHAPPPPSLFQRAFFVFPSMIDGTS